MYGTDVTGRRVVSGRGVARASAACRGAATVPAAWGRRPGIRARDPPGDARMPRHSTAFPQAAELFAWLDRQCRLVHRQRRRPRLPRATLRLAGAGPGARAVGAHLEAARQPPRSPSAAVGNTRDRRPQGRAVCDLLEDASRADRRRIRTHPDATVAFSRSRRHRLSGGVVARAPRAPGSAPGGCTASVECSHRLAGLPRRRFGWRVRRCWNSS